MDPSAAAPALSRPVARWVLAATAAASLYGAGFWALRDRGPERSALVTAAAALRAEHRPGDLVVLAPPYATMARELLGDLHPVAPLDPLAEDLDLHPRVWIVALFGAEAELAPRFAAAGFIQVSERTADGVATALFARDGARSIAYDFTAQLEGARVFHEHADGRIEPCDRREPKNGQGGPYGRWVCRQDADWFYVAPEWHHMGDHLRFCLWAHPPSEGRLRIRYPGVPLTGRLAGRVGHTLNASRNAKERIDFDVEVDGVGAQRFAVGLLETWRPFGLELPTAGTATVTFSVSTPDAGVNHFCFQAGMWR